MGCQTVSEKGLFLLIFIPSSLPIFYCTQIFSNYNVLEELKSYNFDVWTFVKILSDFELLASETGDS